MKNFTYLILAGLFLLVLPVMKAQSQRIGTLNPEFQKPAPGTQADRLTRNRCFTMEGLDIFLRLHPEYKQMSDGLQQHPPPEPSNQRTQAIVNVPVVFHIVGSAARQAQVTDADILWQLNKMNEDYSGANADSTNAAYGFYPIRAKNGYCQIRYCMAQRTPIDLPTNGIDRVVSSLTGTQNCNDVSANGNATLVKHTSSGGADAWDPTRFLNIWVGEFGPCLLGIATFPGTGAANEQGVVVSYEGFSNNPVYVDPAFALGRTVVHETGHYWGLVHIWGDDAGCTNSDFRQISGSSCVFPPSLGGASNDQSVGDTPNQANATTNCPSGAVTDACATSAPGKNYQNYMDYTEDACYSMFTIKQVDRMQYTLDNCRASLKTSNGCTPPVVSGGNDARISAILSPANNATIGCSALTPFVTIQNLGSNALASAKINAVIDGVPVTTGGYPYNWAGPSLTTGGSANVTLPALNIATNGVHTIKIHTTLPNGQVDANATNDTTTVTVTKIAASPLPVVHGFETTLLPSGWTLYNPDNDALQWFRYFPGTGGASTYAGVIDNYFYEEYGKIDDIRTPVITTTGLLANDSLLITFDLAHKNYPGQNDTLAVVVSTDCGTTFTTVWKKWGANLATAGSSTGYYTSPAASDWIKQRVSIGQNLFGGGQIIVGFRNINDYGNVVWIDNINIDVKPRKDMQTTLILRPNPTECTPPFAPSMTVRNNGGEQVTGFKVGYILNGGTPVYQTFNIPLNTGEVTTVTFPNINPPAGNNTIKMFVTDAITASPGADGTPGNDTLTRNFVIPTKVTNVIQGFEGATFIPSNWTLINANNNNTWVRKSPGKASDWSAFLDNYNNNTINQLDIMQAPPVNTVGADSVIISFDVAHKDYPGSFDRLRVLVSTDCSVSFTSVYSKSGPTLATAGESDADFTAPTQNEWRNEVIRLGSLYTGGNIIVQFENRNDYGNNIFVDNINIVPKFKRDIEVLAVAPDVACATGFTPTATVHNRGTETVTGFTITYTIGTGTPVTQNITGINLAPDASTNVTLGAGTLAAGPNNIKVYTSAPVTGSGTGDQYLLNDTILRVSYAVGTVQAPNNVVETFEGTFIPAGWAISNPDNALTWQKAATGKSSTGSAFLRNYTYYSNGQRDLLYSPALAYTGVDSVKLSFDLSATTRDYPGSTMIGMDTVEVLVSKDCGNTFTSVYKKWGSQLQTIGDANYPQPTEFTPNGPLLWRRENIDLTSFAPNGPLQVIFRNTTNNQNDVYVDNVNFRTVTLPPRLKSDGVIVTPNPFGERFDLWFLQAPSDLRFVTVLNSAGQLVWNKVYGNGSSTNVININMSGMAAGVYIINLGYSDKSKDKQIRVIKSN